MQRHVVSSEEAAAERASVQLTDIPDTPGPDTTALHLNTLGALDVNLRGNVSDSSCIYKSRPVYHNWCKLIVPATYVGTLFDGDTYFQ